MKRHKGLIIILDGLGDRPHSSLKGKTPLESARTPTFDDLAWRGQAGFVDPLYPWVPVGTQTGVGLLMGQARADVNRLMRGPIEAAGVGLDIGGGDIAIRCNIATIKDDPQRTIVDRRAGREPMGIDELLDLIDGKEVGPGVTATFRSATQHRVVALLSGGNLSAEVGDTDPGPGRGSHGIRPAVPLDNDPASKTTADAVNRLVDLTIESFRGHEVNIRRAAAGLPKIDGLITRSAGRVQSVRNLINHLGLKAAVVTGERTAVGLGRIFGFSVLTEPGFTGTVSSDVAGKLDTAFSALESHDIVFVHFKGADIAAHDRNPEAKKEYLERVDEALSRHDLKTLVVGVTGDHSTDSTTGWHTGDPVPAIIAAPSTRVDRVKKFGERHCIRGALGHLTATSFLCACIDLMGYAYQFRPVDAPLYSADPD